MKLLETKCIREAKYYCDKINRHMVCFESGVRPFLVVTRKLKVFILVSSNI